MKNKETIIVYKFNVKLNALLYTASSFLYMLEDNDAFIWMIIT
jgi:hypothetical protein